MSIKSEEALEIRGIPYHPHHSRRVDADCLEAADLVLGMEAAHLQDALRVCPGCAARVHTLKGYAAGVDGVPAGRQYDILDPFGQPLNAYLDAEKEIEDAVRGALERIAREHL